MELGSKGRFEPPSGVRGGTPEKFGISVDLECSNGLTRPFEIPKHLRISVISHLKHSRKTLRTDFTNKVRQIELKPDMLNVRINNRSNEQ